MAWTESAATLVLLVGLAACPDQRAPAPQVNSASKPEPDAVLLYHGQPVAPSDVTFTIHRGMCYGTCPDYTVTVHGDGRVDWKGEHFVQQVGERHSRIESEAVQLLLDRAGEMDFFEHAVSFDVSGMDGSNCELTLHIAAQERRADVPHFFMHRDEHGLEVPDWKTMRDEVDFTRCMDAMTESWRWIHTQENADDARLARGDPLTEVPDGFSIGIRRRVEGNAPTYQITIDSQGVGLWHGASHALVLGEQAFTVPRNGMLLLANHAQWTVGIGQDVTVDGGQPDEIRLFVHADGRTPGPRRALSSPPRSHKDDNSQPADFARADALGDLIDVIARTSHFAGGWDEQQSDATSPFPSSK